MRVVLLAGLSMGISSLLAADEKPAAKLEADLLQVKNYAIHVVAETEDDLLGYNWARTSKAKVLARVKSPCALLPDPVFDVASSEVIQGLALPSGSHVLFSPSAELVYIESTPEDVGLVRTALSPAPTREHALFSMDILVTIKLAGKSETLLELKSMPFLSGERIEFGAVGRGRVHLVLEPVVGPDEDEVDFVMEADVQANGNSLKKEFNGRVKRSKPEEIELGMLGDATATLRLTPHLEVDYFGPPILETEAKKAEAIEQIQKAMRKVCATADEPAPRLVSALLHVTEPIHITPELHVPLHDDRPRPELMKAIISPEVRPSLNSLGGKVYDVSATLRDRGMALPQGSRALYGPQTQMLYLESTSDDVETAEALFYSEPPPVEYTADIQVIRKSEGEEETLFEATSVQMVNGRKVEFNLSGRQSLHLMIQPSFGQAYYGAPFIDINVEAKVQEGDNSISILSTWLMHHARPREAILGRLGEAAIILRIQTHSRQGRWGDDPESEKENKAAAIQKIKEELASPRK